MPRLLFPLAPKTPLLAALILSCTSAGEGTGATGAGGAGVGLGGTGAAAGATAGVGAGGSASGAGGAGVAGTAGSTGGSAAGAAGSGAMGGAGQGGTAGAGAVAGNAGQGGTGGDMGTDRTADATYCSEQLVAAATHYQGFLTQYQPALTNSGQVPRSAQNSTLRMVGAGDWTAGFPGGSLWLLFEATGDMAWRSAAELFTEVLYAQRLTTSHHDVGFMINSTYGAGYRLTQNAAYRDVVITAADSLATRYSDVVGATRSWDPASWQRGDWDYAVIIDNMMNLELFMHATTLSADDSYATMGINHAITTLDNHFRPDFSSYHVVDYNPSTGAAVAKQTQQGLHDESAWARGQTWGLYGFTMMHRESGDARFLTQAQAIADFYTQSPLMPEDGVPIFDFQAAEENVTEHRDSSAGAIAASALIELASFSTGEAKERYLDFGIKALRSLSSPAYRAALGENSHFLLMHSVGSFPENSEVDVAMNYADYYYLEGLLRCSRL